LSANIFSRSDGFDGSGEKEGDSSRSGSGDSLRVEPRSSGSVSDGRPLGILALRNPAHGVLEAAHSEWIDRVTPARAVPLPFEGRVRQGLPLSRQDRLPRGDVDLTGEWNPARGGDFGRSLCSRGGQC